MTQEGGVSTSNETVRRTVEYPGLQGRVALVTGAATGLGLEVASQLLAQGSRVALCCRPGGHLEAATELARQHGSERARVYEADLSDGPAVVDLYDRARADFGAMHLLVNNAGVWPQNAFDQIPMEEWDRTFAINCRAPFLLCQRLVQEGGQGLRKIVNITSQAAFNGSTTGHAHYAATKAALVTMTVSLAREHAAAGIRANCLALGIMRSNMTKEALDNKEDYYIGRIPVGRVADPRDIAPAVLFLLGSGSDYLTGATIDATGGMLMR